MKLVRTFSLFLLVILICITNFQCSRTINSNENILEKIGVSRGICVVLGDNKGELAIQIARDSELLVYLQLLNSEDVANAREAADNAGYLGSRVFIEKGSYDKIHLANNIADALIAIDQGDQISRAEALRVIHPNGKVILRNEEITKPFPEGMDDWSHPYHGPDNNPQSEDQIARAPYLTQFLAKPYYAPLTQVAVASSGRVFKAFGNIAFHEREEDYLNTLTAFNGFNGTILWKRRLAPGVMIHRNTMIATPEILYVGDDKSCKIIDAATGQLNDEITLPVDQAGGTFWKWMALEGNILYAQVGKEEQKNPVIQMQRKSHGWPWNPLSKGFNQPENPWGYGHNLFAIDPKNGKILWRHQEDEPIDSRALVMKNGKIYIFRFNAYLACLDAKTGDEIWRKTPDNDPTLFEAIGGDQNLQDWRTNFRTAAYLKCSDKALYFAGPQVKKLLALSTEDASILWEYPYNNFQLIIREDGLYGISGQIDKHKSIQFDPLTGEVLAEFETQRRGCTRPNGTVDAILYRAEGGSVRLDASSKRAEWISPMRAECQDGVTVANGLLYWWPMTCDCQNSILGVTSLGPAGNFDFYKMATTSERLETEVGDLTQVAPLHTTADNWTTFRANNQCTATTDANIEPGGHQLWWYTPKAEVRPTAPVTAGDMVFLSGSDGIVRALNIDNGETIWKAYTGGAVKHSPTVWQDRVFVGSGDGWVYNFEAKTGRLLWRFNAAPENRKIPVYESLMSTWPVATGVLVEDGIAYFAAGIVNYDGTYVYALDAISGEIIWQNNTSGHLDREARTGASVHGHLLILNEKLYMASGTAISPAVYDLATGKCLNDPEPLKICKSNNSRGSELYQVGDEVVVSGKQLYADPDYPVYDPTVTNKILHTTIGDQDIVWLNNQVIKSYRPIDKKTLNQCVANPTTKSFYMNQGWGKFDVPGKPIWEYDCEGSSSIAVCKNAIVMVRKTPSGMHGVEVINLKNGERIEGYRSQLVSPPLPWGMAVDKEGRIIVTLKDGQVICYGARTEI